MSSTRSCRSVPRGDPAHRDALIFATLGEMFSERAGVLNLGIEGIMLISA